jgi:hypothetical protein
MRFRRCTAHATSIDDQATMELQGGALNGWRRNRAIKITVMAPPEARRIPRPRSACSLRRPIVHDEAPVEGAADLCQSLCGAGFSFT